MKEANEYTLLDFSFSSTKKKLKVVLTYFNDIPKVDIREYYLDQEDKSYKPTKKGIQLDPQKAEALRSALEENAAIIDKHLLSEDLQRWAGQIRTITSMQDFFSNYEFFKTKSSGSKEEIIFNNNHPFGKQLVELSTAAEGNDTAQKLIGLINVLLLSYNHSLNQFEEDSKMNIGDFINDQNQTWSSLLKRLV
jgi:hypothetical protein